MYYRNYKYLFYKSRGRIHSAISISSSADLNHVKHLLLLLLNFLVVNKLPDVEHVVAPDQHLPEGAGAAAVNVFLGVGQLHVHVAVSRHQESLGSTNNFNPILTQIQRNFNQIPILIQSDYVPCTRVPTSVSPSQPCRSGHSGTAWGS